VTAHPQADRHRRVVDDYLRALHEGDLAGMLSLFAPGAWVLSPLLGKVAAADFFPKVFASAERSIITPYDVFVSARGEARAVGYFNYEWILKDRTRIVFDAADVFEFAGDARIESLKIYYDSHPFRGDVRGKYE
jgi:hypothetical protein